MGGILELPAVLRSYPGVGAGGRTAGLGEKIFSLTLQNI